MFGNDILKIQTEKINDNAEKERMKMEEQRKIVIEYLKDIKNKLLEQANAGKSLMVAYKNNKEISAHFEMLRKMAWNDGISITRNKDEYTFDEIISAEVERISIDDNYEHMIQEYLYLLDKEKIQYLRSEHDFALRIKDGENVLEIQAEIAKSREINKRLAMLALANAAYRNGLEGEIPELEGVSKIKQTLYVLPSYCAERLVNHTEILHNIYKEKAENRAKTLN